MLLRNLFIVFLMSFWMAGQSEAGGLSLEEVEKLSLKAAQFRTVGVIDASQLNKLFGENRNSFNVKLSIYDDPKVLNAYWSYFFRGVQVYEGAYEDESVAVGFYNVILDSWLVTQWRKVENDFLFDNSSIWLPDSLRSSSKSKVNLGLSWLNLVAELSVVDAIQLQASQRIKEFELLFGNNGEKKCFKLKACLRDLGVRQEFEIRLSAAYSTIVTLMKDNEALTLVRETFNALDSGDARTLLSKYSSEISDQQMTSYMKSPNSVRRSVQPLFVINLPGLTTVISSSPTQARLLFVISLTGQGSASFPYRLSDVSAFDAYQKEVL